LSKNRGAFVEVPYFLSKGDPDPPRFYLTATAPETRDTEPALPVPSQVEGREPKGHPGRISWSATTLSRAEALSSAKGPAKETSWWPHIRYAPLGSARDRRCRPGRRVSCRRGRPFGSAQGRLLREPAPLFKKLDESVIEEEYARLEG
jgi:hypothetical protein